ncbi:type I restriction enzyme HsdR N-terminal domain-containing protein [Synechococcus elongatus IITB4]|uniref:type I restriction enzyme HsdR N-terminal domain-containing protein n=1 Tax=Synechococcus elongatus TaxID=32046 RepID=UPI0030D31125
MPQKTEVDIALEMYESVMQSEDKQRRLRSSTFWGLFNVKARQKKLVDRIEALISEQGLRISVKSGATLGEESSSDWILLSLKLTTPKPKESDEPLERSKWPSQDWFEMLRTRDFESEREVEAYFIAPLLEKLSYDYDDIVIGYGVEIFKGVQKTKAEADFVIFNGRERTKENILLVVEAKKSDKGINVDHIGQARSYAQELFPACYIVSNGQQIIVFQFNGGLAPDERVLELERSELEQRWEELFKYVSKEATLQRKEWMQKKIASMKAN